MTPKNKLFELKSLLESASADLSGLVHLNDDLAKILVSIAFARIMLIDIITEESLKETKSSHDLTDI